MKVVYILSTDGCLQYARMTELSVASLRIWHKNASVVLLTDQISIKILQALWGTALSCFDDVLVIETPVEPALRRSRRLKAKTRLLIDGSYLYLDCDTVVCGSLPLQDQECAGFAAVPNLHRPDGSPTEHDNKLAAACGWAPLTHTYNSGVMLWADTPRTRTLGELYYQKWSELVVTTGLHYDQQALNSALSEVSVHNTALSPIYNAQVDICPSLAFEASVWHIFASASTARRMKTVFDDYWTGKSLINNLDIALAQRHPWNTSLPFDSYIINSFKAITGELPQNDWRRAWLSGNPKAALRFALQHFSGTRVPLFVR